MNGKILATPFKPCKKTITTTTELVSNKAKQQIQRLQPKHLQQQEGMLTGWD